MLFFKKWYVFLIALNVFVANSQNVTEKKKLRDFAFNHFSQFGEDGIVKKIFEVIGVTSKLCLEVGAWDGVFLSNVAYLWKFQGWKAILIEGEKSKLAVLKKNIAGYNCIAVEQYIGNKDNNSIDSILSRLKINETIDLMSIDIDGNDYYIFEALKVKPRVVICEYNPTIPAYLDVYQDYHDHAWEFGCSIGAYLRLAQKKGYTLVAATDVNCFFVDSKYANKFSEFETSLEKIAVNDYLKNVVTSFNGDPIIIGKNKNFLFGLSPKGYNKKLFGKEGALRISNIVLESK